MSAERTYVRWEKNRDAFKVGFVFCKGDGIHETWMKTAVARELLEQMTQVLREPADTMPVTDCRTTDTSSDIQ